LGPLLSCAERSFASFACLGVDCVQRVQEKNLFDLACLNIRFIQKRTRLQSVTGTEWSLEF
jgi:hypothetical protein